MEEQPKPKTQTTILVVFSFIVLAVVGYMFYQAQSSPEATSSLSDSGSYEPTVTNSLNNSPTGATTAKTETTDFDTELKAVDTVLGSIDADISNVEAGLSDQITDLNS